MKNVDSLLKAELEKLGVPVERLKYGGKAACFIVYQLVVGRDTFFSDDEEGAQEFTYQVHVYSKTDYIDILQRLINCPTISGVVNSILSPFVV